MEATFNNAWVDSYLDALVRGEDLVRGQLPMAVDSLSSLPGVNLSP